MISRRALRRLWKVVGAESEGGEVVVTALAMARSQRAPAGSPPGRAEGLREAGHLVGQRRGVEGDGMGEHGGVSVGVDEVERAAEDVAQLVVQPGARRPEGDARQVGAVQQVAATVDVGAVGHHRRE